jgi:spermidine synthase
MPASFAVRVFQFAVFLGAYLLFLVQPLIAKQILPWFGGAPSVWSTCMVFFQIALVAGYAYAHLTRRLGVRRQVKLHLALLALTLLTLPISASPAWKPPDANLPVWRLLVLLGVSVGAPYVMLSATAPLLQDWYRRAAPTRTPYTLYVLSNAGSLAALVSYPAVVERFLPLGAQAIWWSAGFVAFGLACAWCAWPVARGTTADEAAASAEAPAAETSRSDLDGLLWVALAACGSGLLLALTNQLCQDVAVVPLLWIVPLAIYLLTFIISFAGWYSRRWWTGIFLVSVAASAYVLGHTTSMPLLVQIGVLLMVLGAGCMVCHGELARLRPSPERLTAFYLAISIGGGLGGSFVALAAPLLFVSYSELPLLMMLVVALLLVTGFRDVVVRRATQVPVLLVLIPLTGFCVATVVVLRSSAHRPHTVAATRNFYGTLTVVDDDPSNGRPYRALYHGRVLHGAQFLSASAGQRPTTYYAEGSGIDVAIRQHPKRVNGLPLQVGVVGLGAGTIASWGEAGDHFRFFELDPTVVDFARQYFTFLEKSRASIEIVTGDARLSLERELASPENLHSYDVLAVDAFSGDSIPVHLLTRECFALYRQALREDGVLGLHVSNNYLDLPMVVRGLAGEAGLQTLEVDRRADPETGAWKSIWVLVSANDEFLSRASRFAQTVPGDARTLVWTDSFSSLISVLR